MDLVAKGFGIVPDSLEGLVEESNIIGRQAIVSQYRLSVRYVSVSISIWNLVGLDEEYHIKCVSNLVAADDFARNGWRRQGEVTKTESVILVVETKELFSDLWI